MPMSELRVIARISIPVRARVTRTAPWRDCLRRMSRLAGSLQLNARPGDAKRLHRGFQIAVKAGNALSCGIRDGWAFLVK
jgi:hypothetical protein